jgi:hypothetical protein
MAKAVQGLVYPWFPPAYPIQSREASAMVGRRLGR